MFPLHLIHLNWHVKYGAKHWSWGYCSACQDYSAARVQDYTETLYLNGIIPLSRGKKGKVAHCDFCRRGLEQIWNWEGIPFADWSPSEGLAALATKCGVPETYIPTDPSADTRLHSLLSAVQKSSSLTRLSLGPFGIAGGVLAALVVTIPLAMLLFEQRIVQPQVDEFGFTMLAALISVIPGMILGALIEIALRRGSGAKARLVEAYRDYPFDLLRLEELSREYSKAVRKAVQALCDEAPSHSGPDF